MKPTKIEYLITFTQFNNKFKSEDLNIIVTPETYKETMEKFTVVSIQREGNEQ